MAAPALENLVKFNKKLYCCQTMLETKRRKLLTRRSQPACGSPGDRGRDGEAGQATQRRQGDLDRAGQPAGRGLRKPDAGGVLNLKRKQNSFSKKFSHPPPINFLPKTGGRVYPVTSNLYQQFSVT
jgi:hypothetical protein